ncbi:MAG: hypothetical protein COB02_15275 [Candidatus Cloacimonadota bacterium]|nr:MAG: hypothetical protein COB02_15275 [Candidatus Cloacimonadota bacterium]
MFKKASIKRKFQNQIDAIDKQISILFQENKIYLKLSSIKKVLSISKNDTLISIYYPYKHNIKQLLKTPLLVESIVQLLLNQNIYPSKTNLDQFFQLDVFKPFNLYKCDDFEHQLRYQSHQGQYLAYQSTNFIIEAIKNNDSLKLTLYAKHPKFCIFSIETNYSQKDHLFLIFLSFFQINFCKISSINWLDLISQYKYNKVLDTSARYTNFLDDYQSFCGLRMSFIPNVNIGFFISQSFIKQEIFESIIDNNPSSIKSKSLFVSNIDLKQINQFIDKLNYLETEYNYQLPNIKQIKWIENLIESQWIKSNYHLGLQVFDFDTSKVFWVLDQNNKARRYRPFYDFVEEFSLEHTSFKLVSFTKK